MTEDENVVDLNTQILIDIRNELRITNARLDQTNARLDQTNARLDNLIDTMGGTTRSHEVRLTNLEADVEKLKRTAKRRRPEPRPRRR